MKASVIIFISFATFQYHNTPYVKSENNKSPEVEYTIDKDSVRIVAKNILNGEKIWGKNERYLFPLMDSLTSKSATSRAFYFKVFSKICEQADGDVAEVIGQYVLTSFNFDSKEFIKNSHFVSDTAFKSMGFEAGVEIAMSEDDPFSVLEKLKKSTFEKFGSIDSLDKRRLDIFFNKVDEGIKSGD